MQRVPRRPQPVQIEPAGADVPLRDFREALLALRQRRTEVAVAVFVLNLLQFLDDVIRPFLEPRIAGRGPHQAYGGQIMPADVSGELFALDRIPAAVALGLRLQAGAHPVAGQHPVRLQRQQILRVQILRVLQRPARQPHRRQR